ncbi:MAG: hypothetical protein ACT4NY_34020 [Pseudonocardiales bacterium]
MVDVDKLTGFMATHSRLLDRRRFELLLGGGTAQAALTALAAYRNADGGYGSRLEPDLRSGSSQPVSALHAFEVFEDIAPDTTPAAPLLCDWCPARTPNYAASAGSSRHPARCRSKGAPPTRP